MMWFTDGGGVSKRFKNSDWSELSIAGPWLVGVSRYKWTVQKHATSVAEIACFCTLSAFYNMAKQHSREVSAQATDKTTVESQ